jgi:exodeoxyribonuclease-5
MSAIQLSDEQEGGRDTLAPIFHESDKSVAIVAGQAGVGKTTLAAAVADIFPGIVLYAALTAKATAVMRARGCPDPLTLHKLLYHSNPEQKRGELDWTPREQPLDGCLCVVDEASMVDEKLGQHLLDTGASVLAILDPEQLPPISGAGFFSGTPDVLLTQIHRQAANSPIIQLASEIRAGHSPVAKRRDWDVLVSADIVLCAFRDTAYSYNWSIRRRRGYESKYPEIGERICCQRNNYYRGVLNGVVYEVIEVPERGDNLVIIVKDDDGEQAETVVPKRCFTSNIDRHTLHSLPLDLDPFSYGYAITCHRAQGSEWDHVAVLDEGMRWAEFFYRHKSAEVRQVMRRRWSYTAVTRAAKRLAIFRG